MLQDRTHNYTKMEQLKKGKHFFNTAFYLAENRFLYYLLPDSIS